MTAGENIVAALLSARDLRPITERDRRRLRRIARHIERSAAAEVAGELAAVLAEVRVPSFARAGGAA